MDEQLILVLLQQMPALIGLGRELFHKANPSAPPVTDEDVLKGLQIASTSTLLRDSIWLSQHPPNVQ